MLAKIVAHFLSNCYYEQYTGIVICNFEETKRIVHFSEGNIVCVTSDLLSEQLGEKLVAWKKLDRETVQSLYQKMQEPFFWLSTVIQQEGIYTPADLQLLVSQQAQEILYAILSLPINTVQSLSTPLPSYEVPLQLLWPQVVKNWLAQLPLTQLQQLLPPEMNVVLNDKFKQFASNLLPSLCQALTDGNPSITNLLASNLLPTTQLLQEVGFLYFLNALGLTVTPSASVINLPRPPVNAVANPVATTATPNNVDYAQFVTLVKQKVNAIKANVSFYEILEVEPQALITTIEQAYTRLNQFFASEQFPQLQAQPMLKEDVSYILAALTQAKSILTVPSRRLVYDQEHNLLSRPTIKPPPSAANYTPLPGRSTNIMAPLPTNITSGKTPAVKNDDLHALAMQFCYEIENKYAEIKNGSTFYQLLELDRDASAEIIMTAYQRLAQQFSIDKQGRLANYGLDMRQQLTAIQAHLQEARNTLLNAERKKYYDENILRQLRRDPNRITGNNAVPAPPRNNALDANLAGRNTGSQNVLSSFRPIATTDTRNTRNDLKPLNPADSINPANRATGGHPTATPFRPLPDTKSGNSLPVPPPPANFANRATGGQPVASPFRPLTGAEPKPVLPGQPPTDLNSANRATGNHPLLPHLRPNTVDSKPPTANNLPNSGRPAIPPNRPTTGSSPIAGPINSGVFKPLAPDANSRPFTAPNFAGAKSRSFSATEFYIKAIELYDSQRYEDAVAAMQQAVRLSPKDADFWVQLGRCYAKIAGKEKEAEKALLEATRLDPEEADNFIELARYYQNQGIFAKAIEVYEQVLTLDPQNFTAQSAVNQLRNEEKSSSKSSLISRLSFWRKKED